eukprot:1312932-Rhodomonas_salina.1
MRGPENRRWAGSVGRYLEAQTLTGMRIVGTLAQHPEQLRQLADPDVPSLAPHFPAILARLDRSVPVPGVSGAVCALLWRALLCSGCVLRAAWALLHSALA